MAHEVEVLSDTEVEVKLRITAAEMDDQVRKDLKALSTQVRIPGFRPGKIPDKVLRKKFGEHVEKDARQKLIEGALRAAMQEHDLQPIKGPELDVESLVAGPDGTIETSMKLDVLPKVEIRQYKGLAVDVPPVTFTDEDLQREIQNLCQHSAHPHDVDGAAAEGDMIVADVEYSFLDGTSLPVQADQWIDTKQGAIQGMPCEAAVGKFLGVQAGEQVQLSVELAPPFPDEEAHGKTAVAQCRVKKVQRLHVPDADDPEFLAQIGVESRQDLEERLRERMQEQAAGRRNQMIEEACLEQIVETHPFPVPASYLEERCQSERDRVRSDLTQRQVAAEEIETHLLEVEGRLLDSTERRVRTEILLDRIVALEDLQVQDEDIQQYFMRMAQALQIPPQTLFDQMKENGALPGIVANILRDKARQFLREHAALADKEGMEVSSGTGEAPGESPEQEST